MSSSRVNTRPSPETLQPQDIAAERAACSVDIDALSCFIPGSREERDHARWLLSLLKDDPDHTFDKTDRVFQSRTERFFNGQKIALRYFEIRNRHGLEKKDADLLRLFTDEYLPIQVHESMAQPTLMRLASEEQWNEWGPFVRSGRWIGCYMQTELAHGSNLSALRTTATLDLDTDEWVINTPEPSAGKTWIGGSGLTATFGVVMANLVIRGTSYGMHPFLVPLRSLEDHRVLPGRRIVEQGCKLGAPAMDNGYTCFDKARIPRTNLLARFQTVSRDGEYATRNAAAKVMNRGTMTLVRVGLCEIAAHHLARGVTIAVRYGVVRRQGSSKTGAQELEPKILDYPAVQMRVLTALASAFALTFVSQHLRRLYNRMISEIEADGNSALIPLVHGYSSVLKATCTNESLAGIERCRRSMGGHGYSQAAGFDFERNQPTAGLIYEGDNSMLLSGPAANFLVKQFGDKKNRQPELAYLDETRSHALTELELGEPTGLLALLGARARLLVSELASVRQSSGSAGQAHLDSDLAMRASNAHGAYMLGYAFHQRLLQADAKAFPVLDAVLRFYLIQVCVLGSLSDFFETGLLTPAQVSALRRTAAELASGPIRRDALGLAEAFDMDDWYLCSPLACKDGRAYERMIEWMKREPLNGPAARDENGVMRGYHDGIGRLVRGEAVQFKSRL